MGCSLASDSVTLPLRLLGAPGSRSTVEWLLLLRAQRMIHSSSTFSAVLAPETAHARSSWSARGVAPWLLGVTLLGFLGCTEPNQVEPDPKPEPVPASKQEPTWSDKGNAAAAEGDFPAAVKAFEQATRVESEDGKAWLGLARALLKDAGRKIPRRRGESAELRERGFVALRRATQLGTGLASAWFGLGEELEKSGQPREARDLYAVCLEINALTASAPRFRAAERRARGLVVKELEALASAAEQRNDLLPALGHLAEAHVLAEGPSVPRIASAYYSLAARRLVESAIKRLPKGARLALCPITGADGRSSPEAAQLEAELARLLSNHATLKLVGTQVFLNKARVLGIDPRDLGPQDAAQLRSQLSLHTLVTGGLGQRLQVSFLDLAESTVVYSDHFFRLTREENKTEKKVAPPRTDPLRLEVTVLGKRMIGGEAYPVQVSDGTVLHSGDHVQIHYSVDRESYVYVLLDDSKGRVNRLFPRTDLLFPEATFTSLNPVAAKRTHSSPPGDLWFFLDENPGEETLIVLASTKPLGEIDALLEELNKGAGSKVSTEVREKVKTIVTRGFGGVTQSSEKKGYVLGKGRVVHRVAEVVEGWGAVVRQVSFDHR